MSDEKDKKPSVLQSIFSRKHPKGGQEEIGGGDGRVSSASPISELLRLPVDISLEPLYSGREMTQFLEEFLSISGESLVLLSSVLDPLLLESNTVPAKVIRKGTGHGPECPVSTGLPQMARGKILGPLCSECNPDYTLGEAVLRLPLMMNGQVAGVLTMNFPEWPGMLDNEDFFAALSSRTSMEFKIKILEELNRLLQITDDLTRVYNYRYFMKTLDAELERSRRYDHQFTMIIADVVKFQDFNRRHGYDAGDVMLREVARRLRSAVRVTDVVARYSGQQFAIILTETDKAGGEVAMEKMKETVAGLRIELPDSIDEVGVEIKTGMAVFPRDATVSARLIACAEDSLLHSKMDV